MSNVSLIDDKAITILGETADCFFFNIHMYPRIQAENNVLARIR